jgi:hypothetical protein
MKNLVVTCFGLLLAMSAASPNYGQTVYQFDGDTNDDFLVAANWNDILAGPDAVPGPLDQAVINDNFVVKYDTAVAINVASLIVGADWPVTGVTGTAGTLNMSAGSIHVNGAGNAFTIGRACCAGTGVMNMSGDAALTIDGTDPTVGARDVGELNLSGTATVTSPNSYWRFGNYGHNEDIFNPIGGLEGDGLLSVADNATFNGMFVFVGDNSSVGEIRVSDHGSVILTGNLAPRPSGFQALGSAKIQMNGANATLSAVNLESASEVGEIPTLYEFNADPVFGVSPITLSNAVNITNNDLTVNLNGFAWAVGDPDLLLFNAAPGQIYGTFASSIVVGSVVPHRVIYDNQTGDISVRRIPEPSTMMLLGLSLSIAICARRRASR